MSDFDHLKPLVQEMLASNVMIGPALTSVGIGGLSTDMYAIIHEEANSLAHTFWLTPSPIPKGDVPVPASMLINSVAEALTSTAAYLSHLKLGYLDIDETMARVAARLFQDFASKHDVDDLKMITLMVTGYDDYQVINHYQEVEASAFVSGDLHRPWVQYDLQDELQYMIDVGGAVLKERDGKQYVRLTDTGRERYRSIQNFLQDTGFLKRRATLMRWSQFSRMDDYDEIFNTIISFPNLRRDVMEQSGIQSGMRVLELGCGTGEMTLASGLWKLVGADGEIVATDPSFGMIARAKEKQEAMGISNVKFSVAAAENIPYEDDSFDAIVGCAFLHFTDIPVALEEIHRVAKPGAWVTTNYALQFAQSQKFFAEWFEPILVRMNQTANTHEIMPDAELVGKAINRSHYAQIDIIPKSIITYYKNPEMMVKAMVEVANVFEPALMELPWKAQRDMIDLLINRGHDIVAKYGAENLVQIHPGQMLRARVIK